MSWTAERIKKLEKMWKEGKSAADIAKALGGVTRNAVIGKAHRLGLSGRPSPIKPPPKKAQASVPAKARTPLSSSASASAPAAKGKAASAAKAAEKGMERGAEKISAKGKDANRAAEASAAGRAAMPTAKSVAAARGGKAAPSPVIGRQTPELPLPPEPQIKGKKKAPPPGGGASILTLTDRMCKWPIGDPRDPDFYFCGDAVKTGTPYCPEHAALAYQSSSRGRSSQPQPSNDDADVA